MKVTFKAYWNKAWQSGVRRGDLLLRPFGCNEKNLATFLNKLHHWQNEKGETKELDISIDIHYKKRTNDMNALMWALYEIEANVFNNGKGWRELLPEERKGFMTPDQLYLNDLEEHAEIFSIIIEKGSAKWIKEEYRIFNEEPFGDDGKKVKLYGYLSTSKLNTIQMSDWIDRQFRRLSNSGVHLTGASSVGKYWEEYAASKNPEEVPERYYTAKEYKELRPFCEATTEYLGNGGGSLAHIKSRGMGRNPMEGKYLETEVMHLSDTAHALYDNGKGRAAFIKKYPHLKNKIEYGLKKEITAEEVCEIMGTSLEEMADVQSEIEAEERKDIPLM